MSRTPVYALFVSAALAALTVPAHAQAVISVRSGVVHYFEGPVTISGQPLETHLGKFDTIPQGADLRTGKGGRAEVLLTPGVFLRIGENSGIRMVASALSDTRVELLAGSTIIDSRDKEDSAPVTLICKDWNLHQADKGVYRVDFDPPRVVATEGELQASAASGAPVKVAQGMELALTTSNSTEEAAAATKDGLTDWEQGRAEAISADNAISSNIQDPASIPGVDLGLDDFTYFPMLPFPPTATTIGPAYGSLSTDPYLGAYPGAAPLYQPGFYSIYLPGYTRRPLGLPMPGLGISGLGIGISGLGGLRTIYTPSIPYQPGRIGIGGVGGLGVHAPISRPPVTHPMPGPAVHPGVHVIHR